MKILSDYESHLLMNQFKIIKSGDPVIVTHIAQYPPDLHLCNYFDNLQNIEFDEYCMARNL